MILKLYSARKNLSELKGPVKLKQTKGSFSLAKLKHTELPAL